MKKIAYSAVTARVLRLAALLCSALLMAGLCEPPAGGFGNSANDNAANDNAANDNTANDNVANQNGDGGGDLAGQTFTINFDDPNLTGSTEFSLDGANFSGGTVRTAGQPSLYGSGAFAYEVLPGNIVEVTFDQPVDLLELFFVHREDGITEINAFNAEEMRVGSARAAAADASRDEKTRQLELTDTVVRVEVEHTGNGDDWMDNFTFRYAAEGGGS